MPKLTFSEYGHVAYQIKAEDAGSNMVTNILPTDTPSTQGVGSKGQTMFFSESSHVAYQIKVDEAGRNMVANILPTDTPSTQGVGSKGQTTVDLLTQLCITQYYRLSRLDGPVPVFSPLHYCNSTTFISTTAKSIKLITRYEKLVTLINFSVFYNA